MALNIYDKNGILKLTIPPEDSSTHQHGIQEDNVLNLSFTIPDYVIFDVNDYVEFDGARYWIIEQYVPAQKSTLEWSYSSKFYGIESLIARGLVLKLVDKEMQPVFALTAPAYQHMTLMVDNVNRVFGTTDFKVGDVVATDNIHIDYNSTYISDALSQLADKTGTEWWFDNGFTMNLARCEHGAEITLGYRNGLTKLERTTANNVKFFTRLYPLGSTRNIDYSTYGHSRLQLPNGQKFVEQNVEQYGIIEHSEESAFSYIYPRRVGKISAVRSEEKTGQDGNPFKIYYFKDNEIPFDPNDYEIGGLVKQITFASGELNGREFEVNYNSNTKEFEIITQFPDESTQLPNDILIPIVDDDYILWNIKMPEVYYSLAEQEFKEAVDAYMAENDRDKSVYKAPTDYIDIAARGIKLTIGQRVRLESDQYFPVNGYRSGRITKITRKINNPTQMDIEISDVLSKGKITTLENSVSEIRTIIENTRAGLPQIIKSWESTPPADTNLFSALRSMTEFLNKKTDDKAAGLITFLKGAEFGKFIKSMIAGAGAGIDANGNMQVESIEVRSYMKVLELIYNRLSAMEGDYVFTESGTTERIEKIDETTYRLTIRKQWENDFTAFKEGDVLRGIVNTLLSSTKEYYTAWMRVLNVNTTANTITVSVYPGEQVPAGINFPPTELMVLQRWGNAFDTTRQSTWYLSSTEGRIVWLTGVTKPILEESNYGSFYGLPVKLSIFEGKPIDYNAPYLYVKGLAVQDLIRVDYLGNTIKDFRDRGFWQANPAEPYRNTSTLQDDAWHLGAKWRCLVDQTTQEPKWNSTDWVQIEGSKDITCELYPTNGEYFYADDVDFVLRWDVKYGYININSDIQIGDVEWTRDSGDVTSDNLWAVKHTGSHNDIHITNEDVGMNFNENGVTFKVRIFVRDGATITSIEQEFKI